MRADATWDDDFDPPLSIGDMASLDHLVFLIEDIDEGMALVTDHDGADRWIALSELQKVVTSPIRRPW